MSAQEKLNLEELFEKKQKKDLKQLECFQKILNLIHKRIQKTSAQTNLQHCWYQIPEIMFGTACYQQSACIAFVMHKLSENNFIVNFYYPNTIFVSWHHIIPEYIREEIKKKTQVEVDMFGNLLPPETDISSPTTDVAAVSLPDKKRKSTFRPIPPMHHKPLPY